MSSVPVSFRVHTLNELLHCMCMCKCVCSIIAIVVGMCFGKHYCCGIFQFAVYSLLELGLELGANVSLCNG